MSIKELLIQKIHQIDDEDQLNMIFRIIKDSQQDILQISEETKKRIELSRKQFAEGNYFTHEEALEYVKKCREKSVGQ